MATVFTIFLMPQRFVGAPVVLSSCKCRYLVSKKEKNHGSVHHVPMWRHQQQQSNQPLHIIFLHGLPDLVTFGSAENISVGIDLHQDQRSNFDDNSIVSGDSQSRKELEVDAAIHLRLVILDYVFHLSFDVAGLHTSLLEE
ncbi:hypothetical protein Trihar35433_3152 [Trichoderma harzianum]|nr:hypothetical protein Trihar35433_3152 [Trichoderma harzianum]